MNGLKAVRRKPGAKKPETDARQQTRVDTRLNRGGERRNTKLRGPRDDHDLPDLERRVSPYRTQKDRKEIHGPVEAHAEDEAERGAERERPLDETAQVDEGMAGPQRLPQSHQARRETN